MMNNARKKLIAIVGTTGAGKSQLSIEVAKRINGEVINADSMQMYEGLDTITNKHPMEEREGVPHHLLGHVGWNDEYSVLQFERETRSLIDDIHGRGRVPILVGGTHYYIQSVLLNNATIGSNGQDGNPDSSTSTNLDSHKLTSAQMEILESGSPETVFEQLANVDPLIAQKFHPNDHRRIRQALRIYYTTGKKASDLYSQQQEVDPESALRYDSLIFWVFCDKTVLDPRLDQRVDDMVAKGDLINEVKSLYQHYRDLKLSSQCENGSPPDLERGVFQVIGFKEFLPWLEASVTNSSNTNTKTNEEKAKEDLWRDCINDMKTGTRRYANKQTKWINKKLLPAMSRYGAVVSLLDASDLSKWNSDVGERGSKIAQEFMQKQSRDEFSVSLVPPERKDLLDVSHSAGDFSVNPENWKHYKCDACNMTLVGEKAWQTHVASRKHKRMRDSDKKKKEREFWISYKIQKQQTQN